MQTTDSIKDKVLKHPGATRHHTAMPSFNPPPKYGLVVVAWANARLKQFSSSSPPSAAAKQQLPPDGLGAPAMVLGQVVEAVRGSPLEQLLSSNANASPSLNMGIVLRAAKHELRASDIKLPPSVTANALVSGDAVST